MKFSAQLCGKYFRQGLIDGINKPGHNLTQKEYTVYHFLLKGYTLRQIADYYDVSDDTIKSQRSSIYQKLDINFIKKLLT